MQEPLFIKQFLPEEILNVAYSYCIIKYSATKKFNVDNQSSSLIGEYADPLMETLLDMSTSVIEENVGRKLFPTYSYLRIYDLNSDLKIHTDRPSCEYTVALCLGSLPKEVPYEIFIGEEDPSSDYKYYDSNTLEFNRYRIDHKIDMFPNNAVVFQGQNKIHWREYCKHDHFITVFLHYVDQEGKFAEQKFDKRSNLGEESSSKK